MAEIYMDTDAVRGISRTFGQMGDTLQAVNRSMQVAISVLKATAFMGLVGGYAVAYFIEQVQPRVQELAEKCGELDRDLDASVDAYERGDQQGATRFF
jgi:hypothetical protein